MLARLHGWSGHAVLAYYLDIAADLVFVDEVNSLVGKRPIPPDGQASLLPSANPFRVAGEDVEKICERCGKTDGRVYGGTQMLELDPWQPFLSDLRVCIRRILKSHWIHTTQMVFGCRL